MTVSYKLYYYAEITSDVRDARRWYKEQQEGLQKRFAADVKLTLNRVKKHPLHYEIKYKNVRIAYCDIFPYGVHFYIDEPERQIIIIAIIHQHRNPGHSQSR